MSLYSGKSCLLRKCFDEHLHPNNRPDVFRECGTNFNGKKIPSDVRPVSGLLGSFWSVKRRFLGFRLRTRRTQKDSTRLMVPVGSVPAPAAAPTPLSLSSLSLSYHERHKGKNEDDYLLTDDVGGTNSRMNLYGDSDDDNGHTQTVIPNAICTKYFRNAT